MIERYDPFGRPMSLRKVMDRLLEDAFVLPREGRAAGLGEAKVDVYEEGDNLVVEAQLPGVKPEEVEATIEDSTLTIRAETKADVERKDRNYLIREHRRGLFLRSLQLPNTVDTDAVQATLENGILRLIFPKSEQAKPRRLSVTTRGQQALAGGKTGGSAERKEKESPSEPSASRSGSKERSK